MKKIVFALSLFSVLLSTAQSGYEIKINFKNCKDTVAYLAKYTFDKQYLVDTCKKVVKGNIVFKGKKELDKGIYFLVNQDKARYFDFFVNENQKFAMATDTSDIVNHLKATGSKENEDFFNYIRFISDKNKEYLDLKKLTVGKSKEDSTKIMSEKTKKLHGEVSSFEENFVVQQKGKFIGDVVNLKIEHEAKEIPKASNGRPDSIYQYTYYKSHYWEGVNFGDDRLMRTPFLSEKIKKYFNSVIIQHPDTVSKEIDNILSQAKPESDMFKFLLAYFTPTYESAKVMGFDKVFVHIIDNYFRTGKAKGIYEDKTISKITERGDILKPLLLGSQAPDLLMIDTLAHATIKKMGFDTVKTSAGATKLYYDNIQTLAQTFNTLYTQKADYTILLFWDVDCGHCQTEMPKILETYHKLLKEKYNVIVYAVYTQHEYEKWRKYIIDKKLDWINTYDGVHINNLKQKYDIYSTPVIYMLDKNKVIKAKRIGAEQIEDIVKAMEREYKNANKK